MEFTLRKIFEASAEQIYSAWLSSEGHSGMTGGEATVTDKVGAKYTAWDDYIEGENIELVINKRIVQTWRSSQFEDHEEDSLVEIVLNDLGGKTELVLTHTKVPKDGEHYIKGWENHYFLPMKAYFSK